jgi:hypothetical protein
VEVMRTVTKPMILPMLSPSTVTSIKRKVLTPIISSQIKKILLTRTKQIPAPNTTEQQTTVDHAVNNIQTGQSKKTFILQSKEPMKITKESQPFQIEKKSDHGEPINRTLKSNYK